VSAAAAGGGAAERVVSFLLGGELHALPVAAVEEVVEGAVIHPLPRAGRSLLGILRLRGELLPVFDLAPLLGLALRPEAERVVLVVRRAGGGAFGIAADAADELLTLSALYPAPAASPEVDRLLRGIGRASGRLVTVLDPEAIVQGHSTSTTQVNP
jgi:purine-binding chemotaxis protein CheW